MNILIAEDEPVSRHLLHTSLVKWGYNVIVTRNGQEAWQVLQLPDAPQLAIIDWMMPEMDGLEVCRKVRGAPQPQPTYIILLTARGNKTDIVAGLEAGADDYVTKPFNREELHARLNVGRRIVELQDSLAGRVKELEAALAQVQQLQGMLPICAYCKKVRNDQNYWQQVEVYVSEHSDAVFSHSVCPECKEKFLNVELEKFISQSEEK